MRFHNGNTTKCACGTHVTMTEYSCRCVRLEACACAAARGSATAVGHASLEDVCAAGCAVQEGGRAGCGEGALGEHAAIAEEPCAVPCAMLPCCPDSLARHEQRGCGQTLGVPPHNTTQAAACRFVKESGAAGSLELDAMAQHALRTPSPLLPHLDLRGAVRGGAWPWPWAAHPRGDRHCRQQGGKDGNRSPR